MMVKFQCIPMSLTKWSHLLSSILMKVCYTVICIAKLGDSDTIIYDNEIE